MCGQRRPREKGHEGIENMWPKWQVIKVLEAGGETHELERFRVNGSVRGEELSGATGTERVWRPA